MIEEENQNEAEDKQFLREFVEKYPGATPVNIRDGFYPIFVEDVKKGIAYVTARDREEDIIHMEIPVRDLEKTCEEGFKVVAGQFFRMAVRDNGNKADFEYIPPKEITQERIEDRIRYYKRKYGGAI